MPFELRILGSTELNGPLKDADTLIRQPKRVALLAYLAMSTADGFRRRDQVIALFWPELDQSQARTYFRKSLYAIRESFGEEVFTTRGEEELRVDSTRLWCDAVALTAHLRENRWSDALSLYRGELLEGLFPEGVAQEFQEWLSQQRRSLREGVAGAAWEYSRLEEERGDRTAAAVMARRARELDPDNEEGVRRLMGLLDRRGDRGGALRVYSEWQTRLLEEYGVEPDPETRKLARRVQASRKGESHETPPVPPPATARPSPGTSSAPVPVTPRKFVPAMVTALVLLGIFVPGAVLWRNSSEAPVLGARSVAILPLRVTGDSALHDVGLSIAEEMTSALASDTTTVVRSAVRSQELVRQSRNTTELGRQLGVTYLVEGGVLRGPQGGLRVTLRLLRASDAVVLWTGTLDGDSASRSLVPSEITKASAAILRRLAAPL